MVKKKIKISIYLLIAFLSVLVCSLIISKYSCSFKNESEKLKIIAIFPDSLSQIIPITDSTVIPVVYQKMLIDTTLTVQEQKDQFINQVLPSILITKFYLSKRLLRVEKLVTEINKGEKLQHEDQVFLDSMVILNRAESYTNLIVRLTPSPTSLVLAQAALESGWGRSRFVEEGNNLFGIWTTETDSNAMKSENDRDEQAVYVKKYNTIVESVEHYFLTLARHKAYKKFRLKRQNDVDVYQLIDELDSYSENGNEYTRMLKIIIKKNNFELYDKYIIDDVYIYHSWFCDKLKEFKIFFSKIEMKFFE